MVPTGLINTQPRAFFRLLSAFITVQKETTPCLSVFVPSATVFILVVLSATKLCPNLCDSVDCRMSGFPVFQYLLELAQNFILPFLVLQTVGHGTLVSFSLYI